LAQAIPAPSTVHPSSHSVAAMSGLAHISIVLKNTFLDVADGHAEPEPGARRRHNSAPPAFWRQGSEEASGDVDLEAAAAQLVRLDAIVRDDVRPERLANAPVGLPLAWKTPRWSSEADDEDETSTCAGSPTMTEPGSPIANFSVGSAGHAAGTCRPCAFARSSAGCKFGVSCSFCHVVAEHSESVRMRPCKGKRERFKRTMAAIEEKVAENPDLLSSGSLTLPAFVDRDPQAKARIMAHLSQVAAEAYRGRSGFAPHATA